MPSTFLKPAGAASRLDRLPPSPYLRSIVARLSVGGYFELYDLFMTGYIAVGLIQAHLYSATTSNPFDIRGFASFAGAGFAGMFVGTLLFSWFSDRYGRRTMFTFSLAWYSIASLVMAFMSSPWTINLWRFICGVGIGVQLVTISAYIAEITPKGARGRYVAFSQFISYCSVPSVAAISLLAIPHTFFGLAGWRFVAIFGALGGPFAALLWRKLPESPRWLEAHHQCTQATAVIEEMERRVFSSTSIASTSTQPREISSLSEPASTDAEDVPQQGRWAEIWSGAYRKRTIMLLIFNAFQAIGYFGFAAWVPILLVSQGIEVTKSLTYVLAIALLNPFGSLLAMRYADRWERKWQIVALVLTIAVCGLLWAQQRSATGIILLGSVITLANSWFSCVLHTYQPELFPTRIRAQAVGFVYSWSRFTSIFIGFLIAQVLHRYGVTGVFVIVASAMAIVAVVVGIMGPKTGGASLEALSH